MAAAVAPATRVNSLQPSAMPPPIPSPRRQHAHRERERGRERENPIVRGAQGRFEKPLPPPGIPAKDDVFFQRPLAPPPALAPGREREREREALGRIDTPNAPTHSNATSTSLKRTGPAPLALFHSSIPRPPVEPDVFSAKRPNDATAGRPTKRRALEDVRLQEQRLARESEQEKWTAKWLKMFPTLTFHFETDAQEGPGRLLKARTTKMGAKVEQFFSTKVTHLIVKSTSSPAKPKPTTSAPTSLAGAKGPRGSPKNNNPFYDSSKPSSLADKAASLGMKVWTLKKLSDILDRLAPVGQAAAQTQTNSLSTLLEDEKLHGTRERDANAPRPDWYYFRPGSRYLLVEDATARHRTVLVKEYQPQPSKTVPEYPILYETFLKLTTSSETHVPLDEIRDRAWALYVDGEPWKGEQPPNRLTRSTSLRSIPGTPSLPDLQPYHHASGNSVVLTSNIASTSTANISPAIMNGVPGLGAGKGPIMQMSKRVQVLKGNAAKRSSMPGPSSSTSTSRCPLDDLVSRRYTPDSSMHNSRPPPAAPSGIREKTFMTQDQVVAMLRKQRAPVEPDSSITVDKRIRNREKVDAGYRGVKEQDTASGYCENCRLRYDDLSIHLASKKHRRFASNPANFADLDSLLKILCRQINPHFAHDDVPFAPCWDEHGKDEPCERCMRMIGLPDSEAPDGSPSSGGVEEWASESGSTPDNDDTKVELDIEQDEEQEVDEGEEGIFFDESAEGKEFEA